MSKLAYVAAPYSDADPEVVTRRMQLFYKADAYLMNQGYVTVSPLLKHPVVLQEKTPSDWEYWQEYSETLLDACDIMIVIMLPGWESSKGVLGELKFCKENNIPVIFVSVGEFADVQS
jgi:hypothetical protein